MGLLHNKPQLKLHSQNEISKHKEYWFKKSGNEIILNSKSKVSKSVPLVGEGFCQTPTFF